MRYRVIGACVTNIPTSGPLGDTRITLYKDAVFDGDPLDDELRDHLLSMNLIEPVDAPDSSAAAKQPPKAKQ